MARRKLIENIVSLGAVQLASYALPFMSLPYLASRLGVDQLGRVAFVVSAAQIMVILTDYGFNLSAPKAVAVHRADGAEVTRIWASVTLLRGLFAVVGLVLAGALAWSLEHTRAEWDLLLIAYTMVVGNVLFPQWLFQGLERLKVVSVIQIASRVVVFAGTFALIHGPQDVRWAVLLQSAGPLLGGVLALPATWKALDVRSLAWPSRTRLRQDLREGWHVFLSTAAVNIYTSCNAFFLGLLASPTAVGHYHIAEKLIRAVQMVFGPVSNAVYPHVSSLAASDPAAALRFNRRLLKWMTAGAGVVSLAVFVLAPWVVAHFFGASYAPAAQVAQVFALLPPLIVASNILGIQTMLPLGMQASFSRVLLSAAALDLVLFVPAAWRYGALGAGWAIVGVELFVTLAMAWVLHRAGCSPLTTPLSKIATQTPDEKRAFV